MSGERINFEAYCKAFEVMAEAGYSQASQICKQLVPAEEWIGHDYTESELIEGAKEFCSTTCKDSFPKPGRLASGRR